MGKIASLQIVLILIVGRVASQSVLGSISWDPEGEDYIGLPVEECGTKDATNQKDFAGLRYLNMIPPCEKTSYTGYCGIRRHQNITLIAKFLTKTYNSQFRIRAHLVDKHFGFETAVWPEFSGCGDFFNLTCPSVSSLVNAYVVSEIPTEIPPLSAILRVRLVSVNDNNEKNIAICKQIKLHVI